MKLGGHARFLYLAWRHGGNDPFRLYHGLGEDYVPLEEPFDAVGGWPEPRPVLPRDPQRVRNVVYAFGVVAETEALARAAEQV